MIGGLPDAERVRMMREVLTASGAGIYLATHLAGPLPAETHAAVRDSEDLELRIGRVGPDRAEDMAQREKEARAVAAAVMHASPERLVLTHGAAEATRLVALEVLALRSGARPGAGVEPATVLVLQGLDPLLLEVLRAVARACGATLRVVPEATAIVSGDVVLVAAPHVQGDGSVVDVAQLGQAARSAGARLLVDVGLSCGAMAVDVATLGADAVVCDAHRWLLGPQATAMAWLGPRMGDEAPARLHVAVGPFPRSALLALARSLGWLLMYAELPWVLDRTARLADTLLGSLMAIEGVHVAGDAVEHAALVAFSIDGWNAEKAADELSRSVFAMLEADVEGDLLRASVGAWNREDELQRFTERVAVLAAHTPETLPRKPSLTIISGPPGAAP